MAGALATELITWKRVLPAAWMPEFKFWPGETLEIYGSCGTNKGRMRIPISEGYGKAFDRVEREVSEFMYGLI